MNDGFYIDFDEREWNKASELYLEATGKDEVYIVNRAMRQTIFRAAIEIKVTPYGKLRGDIEKSGAAMINRARVKSGKHPLSGATLQRAVKGLLKRKSKSRGYIRAGWILPFKVFGGKFIKGAKLYEGKLASRSRAFPARKNRTMAEAENWSVGAEEVGLKPLEDAISYVAKDMQNFALGKLNKTAKKYSGK